MLDWLARRVLRSCKGLSALLLSSGAAPVAVIDALESGHLSGAALDVLENEHGLCYLNRSGETLPNRELALLRAMPNAILTPHVAFYTDEVISNMIESTLQSLHAFENGQPNPLEIKAG